VGDACSALVLAAGLTVEAVGLRGHDSYVGFVGSMVVLGAIALGFASRRYFARGTS
jgi:hypothetical protein